MNPTIMARERYINIISSFLTLVFNETFPSEL